ncbi:MAG: TetR/AcrR family transcriptional regulator, partial [Burkholderiaceae bacterium]|nr:TetR/AcrR family transcriptional regulator [Burkholderiaceae bacterium]
VVTELAHEAARHESAAARITHFVSGWYAIQRDIARQARPELVSFNEVRTLPPSHSGAVFDAYNDMFRAVRGLLGKASAGTFLRMQLNARTHLLLSLTMWVRLLVRRHEPDDYDLVACRVCDILLNGLAAPGARWRDDAPALEMPISRVEAAGAAAAPDPAALDFLRAATALINEQGYRGASVDRISARLNVTKGSFYHHHVTKDDLVFACFEHSFATIRLANAHARAYPGSGWDRLGLASRMLVRHQLSRRGPLLRVTAWSALPPDLRQGTLHTLNGLTEKFGVFVVDGIIDGSIRPLDPSVAAQLVSAMINAVAELPLWARGVTEQTVAALFARPLFLGIGCQTLPDKG